MKSPPFASGWVHRSPDAGCPDHAFKTQVVKGIKVKIFADFLYGFSGSNEFRIRGEINPVIAGIAGRRAADEHVHLFYSYFTQRPDPAASGCSPDDGVLNDDNPFALQKGTYRVEFYSNAKIAHGLGGLDKGTAYIMVSDNSHLKGYARLL